MKKFASMPRPQWSNWDAIQEAEEVLPGIWSVSTASHGGLILSGERQEAMPEALRIEGGSYEEDVNWSHVVLAFDAEFRENSKLPAAYIDLARDCVRCWHPDAFAAFTGEPVTEEESYILSAAAPTRPALANCASPPHGETGPTGCPKARRASWDR